MKDLSDLPTTRQPVPGQTPDAVNRFGLVLAEEWFANYLAMGEDSREKAVKGTRFRNSQAGACARQICYDAVVPHGQQSNPLTIADAWRFNLGSMVHEHLQAFLPKAFPNSEVETKVDMRPLGLDSSGHVDAVVTITTEGRPYKIAIEYKSINGFGFKMAVGARGNPEGPRSSAVIQGALNALALDADEMVIVYVSLELLSPREATKLGCDEEGRFLAEWSYTREQYITIAQDEIARLTRIGSYLDEGLLTPRVIPGLPIGAEVVDPIKKMWVVRNVEGRVMNTGTCWQCDYCSHHDRCAIDGPGVIPYGQGNNDVPGNASAE